MCLKYCKSFRVVLKEKNIIIRRPRYSDLKSLLEFINSIVEEDIFINVNKRLTLAEEKKWVKETFDKIRKNKEHVLVADYKGEIIGNISVTKRDYRQSHLGLIGISVKKNYRNIGIGTVLLKSAIDIAKKDPELKILYLDAFAENKKAIKLYKKIGFRTIAKLPNRVSYKGKYSDQLIMDYPLNKI